MYSVYVTNKLGDFVYVRLSVEKIGHLEKIKEGLDVFNNNSVSQFSKEYVSLLAINGFCLIPPGKTCTFSVENAAAFMFVSVVCSSTIWVTNFPFDPKMYGCVAISEFSPCERFIIGVSPYNPQAVWIPANKGDKLPSNVIKAGTGTVFEHPLYFGRNVSMNGMPCAVTSNANSLCSMWVTAGNMKHESGEFLTNTGFELIRGKRGDPIPPNAIMTGVTEADGSLYLGRVGGTFPCHITTDEAGKIHSFVYGFDKERRVANGEVMVLTR